MPLQFNLCEKPLFNIIRLKISRILQEKAKLSTKTREKKIILYISDFNAKC